MKSDASAIETVAEARGRAGARRPRIALFCHRFFELRFMIVSRLIGELALRSELTVILPPSMVESFRPMLPADVHVLGADFAPAGKGARTRLLTWLDNVLYLTFAHTDRLPNATARLHREHHLAWARGKSPGASILARVRVAIAVAASQVRPLRKGLQWAYRTLCARDAGGGVLGRLRPDLAVGCSFGMGLRDGSFLAEARRLGIPSAAVVQTWDRTSNKGYPTVHPDAAIVWNEVMRQESVVNLEFPEDRVFVEGAPLWDRHFTREGLMTEAEWRQSLGIPPGRPVVFYACGGFGSHPANLQVIPEVFRLVEDQRLPGAPCCVFRLYPQYYAPLGEERDAGRKRAEIEALLERFAASPDIWITRPRVEFDGKNFMPSEEDQRFMLSCLNHCAVSLSQSSSQMIEAAIFGKPAISIEYGRRTTDRYDVDIGDYLPEHLLRIHRVGAIGRARNAAELGLLITEALADPLELASARERLIDQEAPVNRGTAARAVAKRILSLVPSA